MRVEFSCPKEFYSAGKAFRVNTKDSIILRQRKRHIRQRLAPRHWPAQSQPMFRPCPIQYEMAQRTRAIACGGLGAVHVLAHQSGLVQAINEHVHVLKVHLPYFESDHILNLAYNPLAGGTCLDDIELLRNDEGVLDALHTERLPDPTTAGDFVRRFDRDTIIALLEAPQAIRVRMWKKRLSRAQRREGILDVDGTIAPTTGECKQGMGLSYKGVWGYHPLIVSLANTPEPLYLVNRPGNRPSHEGAVEWMDRAAHVVGQAFEKVIFRGDTDFALTANFDRWSAQGIGFAFGIDAMPNLVKIAESLENTGAFSPLERPVKRERHGPERERPPKIKEQIVMENGYKNIKLKGESIAQVAYRPGQCQRDYRLVILRKDLSIERGEHVLFPEIRYFFYITNLKERTPREIVLFCNDRCNQENLIEQLKNGLNALRMPVGDLVSNWAYMVIVALGWTLKTWWALLVRDGQRREELLKMEFKRFRQAMIQLPAQIIRSGRRVIYRLLNYQPFTRTFLETFERVRSLGWT
jgi:hypothetical protein